jgi:hypothetical protein
MVLRLLIILVVTMALASGVKEIGPTKIKKENKLLCLTLSEK